jgi:hypothetical protein
LAGGGRDAESHDLAATQEVLVNSFQPVERHGSLRGGEANWRTGARVRFGAECAASFGLGGCTDFVLDDSSDEGPSFSGGDAGEVSSGETFVPAGNSAELGTRRQ